MKTTTAKIFMVFTLVTLVVMITSSFKTRIGVGNKYLTMRIIEHFAGAPGWDPKIVIVYENEKVEEIELEKTSEKTFIQNMKVINATLNSLAMKGYELVCTTENKYTFVKNN